jgi:hypothetical protein
LISKALLESEWVKDKYDGVDWKSIAVNLTWWFSIILGLVMLNYWAVLVNSELKQRNKVILAELTPLWKH